MSFPSTSDGPFGKINFSELGGYRRGAQNRQAPIERRATSFTVIPAWSHRSAWGKSSNRYQSVAADVHLVALWLQIPVRIAIGEEYDLLVARTAERFVAASHRLPEPAKDAEVQEPLDLVKQRGVSSHPCVSITWLPMPLPLSQFMRRVAAEHANREPRPSQFDVLAKKTELRGLLKWLAARKGHAFYSVTGKNPFPNLIHRLVTAPIEPVGGRVPAAATTQITALKPYHHPFSGTI